MNPRLLLQIKETHKELTNGIKMTPHPLSEDFIQHMIHKAKNGKKEEITFPIHPAKHNVEFNAKTVDDLIYAAFGEKVHPFSYRIENYVFVITVTKKDFSKFLNTIIQREVRATKQAPIEVDDDDVQIVTKKIKKTTVQDTMSDDEPPVKKVRKAFKSDEWEVFISMFYQEAIHEMQELQNRVERHEMYLAWSCWIHDAAKRGLIEPGMIAGMDTFYLCFEKLYPHLVCESTEHANKVQYRNLYIALPRHKRMPLLPYGVKKQIERLQRKLKQQQTTDTGGFQIN